MILKNFPDKPGSFFVLLRIIISQPIRNSYNSLMVFSSFPFLWIFLPIILIGAMLTQKKGSNLFLLVISLLFYAWGEPKYIILLLFSITVNYCAGLLIDSLSGKIPKKAVTAAAIMLDLGLLGYFKYFNFFAGAFNQLARTDLIALRAIALPIGISFYTFQSISYIADLYRGTIKVQRSWFRLALYISFFPQLIAGPIVKYKDIEPYLSSRRMTAEHAVSGLKRFCFGLGKKVLLANTLGYTVDEILKHPIADLSALLCWTAAVFYTLQIYFDFSGYSDMAIGLAETLGFKFKENFDLPYCSRSVREFWRRWHISLSTWFRDYLYIPLGGNRKGSLRTILNLLIVFFATGLWHGAQWNFVIWGLFHGFFLILERLIPHREASGFPGRLISRIYALLVACAGWVLFRADDLTMAWEQLRKMFLPVGQGYWNLTEFVGPETALIFLISLIFAFGWPKPVISRLKNGKGAAAAILGDAAAILCLFLSIVMLANAAHNPFIYFRF